MGSRPFQRSEFRLRSRSHEWPVDVHSSHLSATIYHQNQSHLLHITTRLYRLTEKTSAIRGFSTSTERSQLTFIRDNLRSKSEPPSANNYEIIQADREDRGHLRYPPWVRRRAYGAAGGGWDGAWYEEGAVRPECLRDRRWEWAGWDGRGTRRIWTLSLGWNSNRWAPILLRRPPPPPLLLPPSPRLLPRTCRAADPKVAFAG
eukprot:COSAG02_NODE_564_length_20286_cov_52.743696_10_plen_203_part_00